LLIIDQIERSDAINRMINEYGDEFDVLKLIDDGIITIVSSSEWYFSENSFKTDKTILKWNTTIDFVISNIDESLKSGTRKDLRVFWDTKTFFKKGNWFDLIEYEEFFEKKFSFGLNVICAYQNEDIEKLDLNQLKLLLEKHELINANNYNALVNPSFNTHLILLYENKIDLDNAIANYLNEGLKRGQLCIHASVNLMNKGYVKDFSSRINNYEKNVKEGNIVLVNLAQNYIDVMIGNLDPFNKLKEELIDKVKKDNNRRDKHIRLTADCATLLLKNKHFDECSELEEWWHRKPFEGSYVCPYPKVLLDQFPHKYHLDKIFNNHDIVVDCNGNLIQEYMKR
jgi:hypothetical protein